MTGGEPRSTIRWILHHAIKLYTDWRLYVLFAGVVVVILGVPAVVDRVADTRGEWYVVGVFAGMGLEMLASWLTNRFGPIGSKEEA